MARERGGTNSLITGITLIALGVVGMLVLITAGMGGFGPGVNVRAVWPGTDGPAGPGFFGSQAEPDDFSSLGEQIYYTGRGEGDRVIPRSDTVMHVNACVDCHGRDGRGGRVRIMMGSFESPDIRWGVLTGEEEGEGHAEEGEEEHPPYNAEKFARALWEGEEPDGEDLDQIMPRWDMTDREIEALIDYLDGL